MKQKILISALALVALMALSCKGKDDRISGAADGPSAYALRVNTPLYSLEVDTGGESDRTRLAASMNLGEKVQVGKERRLTFSGDGDVYTFVEVLRDDGTEGYSMISHIAVGANLAVVTDEKANLYRMPQPIDVTGQEISRRTLVALFPETEKDGFVEIKAYDPEIRVDRQNFIRLSSLSRREADVQSSILLQTAQSLRNDGAEKVRRDVLLESATKDYPDSVFRTEIAALAGNRSTAPAARTTTTTAAAEAAAPDPEPASTPNYGPSIATETMGRRQMVVNTDNAVLFDTPSSARGTEVGRLHKGDEVTINERTSDSFTVDGQRARWYRTTGSSVEGWIFGVYLSEPGR
ncbi:MAG: hypothetical protein LBI06_08155 [Treponema sp.]|jgi:hypothetical protein|nr:hypothetical protein [Treponema sp.]